MKDRTPYFCVTNNIALCRDAPDNLEVTLKAGEEILEQFETENPLILEIYRENGEINKHKSQLVKIQDQSRLKRSLYEIQQNYLEYGFDWEQTIQHFQEINQTLVLENPDYREEAKKIKQIYTAQ